MGYWWDSIPPYETLVDFATIAGAQPSLPNAAVDVSAAFATALKTLTPGQALYLRFDPARVDSNGYCNYMISTPIELTAEIPIIAESRKVAITLIPSSDWGTKYCHAIRNWNHSDYAGTIPSEVVDKAPDTTAVPVYVHNLYSLDGNGLMVRLNGANNVSAVSLVHPHEYSRVHVTAETGSSAGSPFQWGNRVLSIFSNNDASGVAAGPFYWSIQAYGQGWDHFLYIDGTNGGTNTKWVQDFHLTDSYTAPLWNTPYTFKNCLKSPFKIKAVNRLVFEGVHNEACSYNAPPTVGKGAWPGGTSAVAAGTRVVAKCASGANAGLAGVFVATTAGTTAAAEPAWPSSGAIVDGSVTWTFQTYSSTNGGNGNNGATDGMTAWPGAAVTVPIGTTISPDGTHGWVCTTSGITGGGASPVFDTSAGRGSTVTDSTVVWTYAIDTFDSAVIRCTDVAQPVISDSRLSAYSSGSNLPMWKADNTGTAPGAYSTIVPPNLNALDIELSGLSVTGMATLDKGGWYGNIIEDPFVTLAFNAIAFDPRHIDTFNAYQMQYLHGSAFVPTQKATRSAVTFVRKSDTQSVTNSTVQVNDTQLAIAVRAGKTYRIEGMLTVDGSTTGDFKFSLNCPTLANLDWQCTALSPTSTSNTGTVQQRNQTGDAQVQTVGTVGAGSKICVVFHGVLVTGTSDDTLQLKWAQNTADATATTLYPGSYLTVIDQGA